MDKKDKFEVKTHFLMAICGGRVFDTYDTKHL